MPVFLLCPSSRPEISAKGIAAPDFFAERRPPCRFWMPDFATKKRNRHGGRRSGQKAGAYAHPLRGPDRRQAIPLALISALASKRKWRAPDPRGTERAVREPPRTALQAVTANIRSPKADPKMRFEIGGESRKARTACWLGIVEQASLPVHDARASFARATTSSGQPGAMDQGRAQAPG